MTQALVGNYMRHDDGPAPAPGVEAPWYSLEHRFVIERGEARLPRPPISAKVAGTPPSPVTAGKAPRMLREAGL